MAKIHDTYVNTQATIICIGHSGKQRLDGTVVYKICSLTEFLIFAVKVYFLSNFIWFILQEKS